MARMGPGGTRVSPSSSTGSSGSTSDSTTSSSDPDPAPSPDPDPMEDLVRKKKRTMYDGSSDDGGASDDSNTDSTDSVTTTTPEDRPDEDTGPTSDGSGGKDVPQPDGANDDKGYESDDSGGGSDNGGPNDSNTPGNQRVKAEGPGPTQGDAGKPSTPAVGGPPTMVNPDTGKLEGPAFKKNSDYYDGFENRGTKELTSPGPSGDSLSNANLDDKYSSTSELKKDISSQTDLKPGEDFAVSRSGGSFSVSYTKDRQREVAAQKLDQQVSSAYIDPNDLVRTDSGWGLDKQTRQRVAEARTARKIGAGRNDIDVQNGAVQAESEQGARALSEYAARQKNPNASEVETTEVEDGVFRSTVTQTEGRTMPSRGVDELTSVVAAPKALSGGLDMSAPAGKRKAMLRMTAGGPSQTQASRERANRGISAQARSEGVDQQKLEAQTGRDVNGDGDVTSPREYAEQQVREQFNAATGADLDLSDVDVERKKDGSFAGVLTDSGEKKLERQMETSSFTAKVPGEGTVPGEAVDSFWSRMTGQSEAGVTVSGNTADVEVKSGPGGTSIKRTERSGLGSWGGAWNAWEGAVDKVTGAVSGAADTAADTLAKKGRSPVRTAIYETATGEEAPAAVEKGRAKYVAGAVRGAGGLAEAGGKIVTEAPELAYAIGTKPGATGRAIPGALAGSLASSGNYAAENPAGFAGQLVGGAAMSGGAVRALSGTRFSGAAEAVASPGGTLVKQVRGADVDGMRNVARSAGSRARDAASEAADRARQWPYGGGESRGMANPPGAGLVSRGAEKAQDAADSMSGGTGGLMDELSDALSNFETGRGIRRAKRRAEERMLEKAQERATADDAETRTVDSRPGGDYTSTGGPGGGYTSERGPGAARRRSRSGPTEAQRQAWGRRGTRRSRSTREQAEASEVEAGQGLQFGLGTKLGVTAASATASIGASRAAQSANARASAAARSASEARQAQAAASEAEALSARGTADEATAVRQASAQEAESETAMQQETSASREAAREATTNVGFSRGTSGRSKQEEQQPREAEQRSSMAELRGRGRSGRGEDRPGFGYLTETFAGLAGAKVATDTGGSGDLTFGSARVESGGERFMDTLSVFGLGE